MDLTTPGKVMLIGGVIYVGMYVAQPLLPHTRGLNIESFHAIRLAQAAAVTGSTNNAPGLSHGFDYMSNKAYTVVDPKVARPPYEQMPWQPITAQLSALLE